MTFTFGSREAADGTALATYRAPADHPRAAIVLVHGLGEYLGRYQHVADQLVRRGFDVRGTDLRGFGRSGGDRGYVGRFSQYGEDLAGDVAAASQLGIPVVVLGHSLGGLIATLYAVGPHPQPDLLVLSAPSLDANVPAAKAMLAKLLGRVMPRFKVPNGLKGEQLSHDPAVGERYFADPLMFHKTTARLGMEMLAAMNESQTKLDLIKQPTLVIHGGEDPIVDPGFTEPLGELTVSTRVVLAGMRHETLNEEGGTMAVTTIADWLDARV